MTSDGSSTLAAAPARTTHRIEERSITLQRIIHAPRDLVFLAWIDPVHIARWWGPHGFRSVVRQMDVNVGGTFRICMVGPDGAEYPIRGVYRQIVEPERLAYTDDWDDERAPQPSEVTVDFAEQGAEETLLTVSIVFPGRDERERAQELGTVPGWSDSFERLDGYLAER